MYTPAARRRPHLFAIAQPRPTHLLPTRSNRASCFLSSFAIVAVCPRIRLLCLFVCFFRYDVSVQTPTRRSGVIYLNVPSFYSTEESAAGDPLSHSGTTLRPSYRRFVNNIHISPRAHIAYHRKVHTKTLLHLKSPIPTLRRHPAISSPSIPLIQAQRPPECTASAVAY